MRAPYRVNLFAILLGTGAHAITVIFILSLLSLVHVTSFLMIRPLAFYLATLGLSSSSFINGYVVVRVLRVFNSQSNWKISTGVSAILFPLFLLANIFLIDLLEAAEEDALDFPVERTIISWGLWVILSIPVSYYGGIIGISQEGQEEFGN